MATQQTIKCPPALAEILLAHMQQQQVRMWPGSDGLTVDEVLAFFLDAAALYGVPNPDELLELHPELAKELELFFGSRLGKPT